MGVFARVHQPVACALQRLVARAPRWECHMRCEEYRPRSIRAAFQKKSRRRPTAFFLVWYPTHESMFVKDSYVTKVAERTEGGGKGGSAEVLVPLASRTTT